MTVGGVVVKMGGVDVTASEEGGDERSSKLISSLGPALDDIIMSGMADEQVLVIGKLKEREAATDTSELVLVAIFCLLLEASGFARTSLMI